MPLVRLRFAINFYLAFYILLFCLHAERRCWDAEAEAEAEAGGFVVLAIVDLCIAKETT